MAIDGLRFVVLKGHAGFGDRLAILMNAIAYARATDRFLVVDWRDKTWTHDTSLPGDHYFSLPGVKTFSIEDFLAYFEAYRDHLSVTPQPWRYRMSDPDFDDYATKKIFLASEKQSVFSKILQDKTADFTEDIVVYTGYGNYLILNQYFSFFNPSRWVTDAVRQFAQRESLTQNAYDVVHLRAGNKPWAGGDLSDTGEKFAEKIKSNWPELDPYLDELNNRYMTLPNRKSDLIILTDSAWLGRQWIKRFDCGRMLPCFNTKLSGSGLHKLNRSDLADTGVDKEHLNYETLRDFFVMLNAENVIHDGHSKFSITASDINKAGINPCCFQSNPNIS